MQVDGYEYAGMAASLQPGVRKLPSAAACPRLYAPQWRQGSRKCRSHAQAHVGQACVLSAQDSFLIFTVSGLDLQTNISTL